MAAPLNPETTRDPKRDCCQPALFDFIWEAGGGRWVDIDLDAAAQRCGILAASVKQELVQMARRGAIDLFKAGDELAAKPLHERTYVVRARASA